MTLFSSLAYQLAESFNVFGLTAFLSTAASLVGVVCVGVNVFCALVARSPKSSGSNFLFCLNNRFVCNMRS
jgi:hypothetical protein